MPKKHEGVRFMQLSFKEGAGSSPSKQRNMAASSPWFKKDSGRGILESFSLLKEGHCGGKESLHGGPRETIL